MQREHAALPKIQDSKSTQHLSTPKRLRNTASNTNVSSNSQTTGSRSRATMGPSDFSIPGLVTKKRIPARGTQSPTPPAQPPSQAPAKPEMDSHDVELGLLYDKYLQAIMTEAITTEKIEEKERIMDNQMASIAKQGNLAREKLDMAKSKEIAIKYLTDLQNNIDGQLADSVSCIDILETNDKVKEKLLELQSVLKPMNRMRCKGVVVPETSDDLEELLKVLNESSRTLMLIKKSIGDKGDTYQSVEKSINEFVDKYSEIENIQKKLREALCSSQALILKESSNSLSQKYINE